MRPEDLDKQAYRQDIRPLAFLARTVVANEDIQPKTRQGVARIKRITRELIGLLNDGIDSETDLTVAYGNWAYRYEKEFIARVHSGEVSMAEILEQPGPPLTDSLNYPAYWSEPEKWNPGLALVNAVMHPVAFALLRLPANRLTELWQIQQGESETRQDISARNYRHQGGYRNFKGVVRWGGIHEVYSYVDQLELREPISHTFQLSVITKLPHLFYECRFSGSLRNGSGTLEQRLKILPSVAHVVDTK